MLSQVVSASAAIFRVDDDVRRLESLARDSQRRTRLVLIYRNKQPAARGGAGPVRVATRRERDRATGPGRLVPGRRYNDNLGGEHATPTGRGTTLNE